MRQYVPSPREERQEANLKIQKQGHVATQARMKADTEFDKLLTLKQEHQKLKQELAVRTVTSTAEAVADEPTKAELNELLAQEHALQAARRRLVMNFAANPTLLVRRRRSNTTSPDDEDDTEFTDKPPDDPKPPLKAPTSDGADKTALFHRAIMAESDHSITHLVRAAKPLESDSPNGPKTWLESWSQPYSTRTGDTAQSD